jgi:hypothetical protein
MSFNSGRIIFSVIKRDNLDETSNVTQSFLDIKDAKELIKKNCNRISADGWDGWFFSDPSKKRADFYFEISENMIT